MFSKFIKLVFYIRLFFIGKRMYSHLTGDNFGIYFYGGVYKLDNIIRLSNNKCVLVLSHTLFGTVIIINLVINDADFIGYNIYKLRYRATTSGDNIYLYISYEKWLALHSVTRVFYV